MKISVVISVFNEESMLPGCLDSLYKQSRPADEVIVVDNNSTDKSVEIARHFGAKVVYEKRQGIWAARHKGYDTASGTIIVCTDADARFPKHWLKNIEKHFIEKDTIGVVGPGVFYDGSKIANALASWLYMKPYFFLTQLALTTKPLFGSNFAIRKTAWDRVRHEVHSGQEDIFDDLDMTYHILSHGKIIYSDAGWHRAGADARGATMTDFTPFDQTSFDQLLRGHAGLLEDSVHDRWVRAQALFEERAYREAAVLLTELLDDPGEVVHELTDVRLLLARSLFHSAQLDGTIRVATELLEHDPNEPYAHLLVGRALERKGRKDEAKPHLRLAELLGGYRS